MAAITQNSVYAFDRFLNDSVTGYALHGYDPVAYFDKLQPIMGRSAFEVEWQNFFWRFENQANKERFLEAPQIYVPAFNGYGAFSIANNRLADGNPLIWALFENKLFFFHSFEMRQIWAQNPQKFYEMGKQNWPKLYKRLAR